MTTKLENLGQPEHLIPPFTYGVTKRGHGEKGTVKQITRVAFKPLNEVQVSGLAQRVRALLPRRQG